MRELVNWLNIKTLSISNTTQTINLISAFVFKWHYVLEYFRYSLMKTEIFVYKTRLTKYYWKTHPVIVSCRTVLQSTPIRGLVSPFWIDVDLGSFNILTFTLQRDKGQRKTLKYSEVSSDLYISVYLLFMWLLYWINVTYSKIRNNQLDTGRWL